jgi:hypothetical protein
VRVFVANRLASAARDFFLSLGLKQHHIQGGRGVKASQIKEICKYAKYVKKYIDKRAGAGTAGSNGSMRWYVEEKEYATKIIFYSALHETLVKLANQRDDIL